MMEGFGLDIPMILPEKRLWPNPMLSVIIKEDP